MQGIKCKQCENSHIEFGNTSVEIVRTKTIKRCEHCNNTTTEKTHDFFCSEECYYKYLRDCMEHGDF